MEKEAKKRFRNQNLQKIILETVKGVGILSVALLAPNVIANLNKVGILKTRRQREVIINSRKRLVASGLLNYSRDGSLSLTQKGEEKLSYFERIEYKIEKPTHWDKKWRVLIFDIREERKTTRDKVRVTLQSIGFYRLQDSVWVYPYDCEDLITLLKADFKIGRDLLYIIADSIENDIRLKAHFNLVLTTQ